MPLPTRPNRRSSTRRRIIILILLSTFKSSPPDQGRRPRYRRPRYGIILCPPRPTHGRRLGAQDGVLVDSLPGARVACVSTTAPFFFSVAASKVWVCLPCTRQFARDFLIKAENRFIAPTESCYGAPRSLASCCTFLSHAHHIQDSAALVVACMLLTHERCACCSHACCLRTSSGAAAMYIQMIKARVYRP